MSIIFVLLPLSVLLGLVFLAAYVWSVSTNQYEDLSTPAVRMLADEESEFNNLNGRK